MNLTFCRVTDVNFHIPKPKTNFMKKSISYSACDFTMQQFAKGNKGTGNNDQLI